MEYDLQVRKHPFLAGEHRIYRFLNGRGASVIPVMNSPFDMSVIPGVVELAVLDRAGNLDYSTPITSDVMRVSVDDLDSVLESIAELP